MIKRLRYKFIWVAMSSVGIIFCLMLFAVNISMTVSTRKEVAVTLERVADGNGKLDSPKEARFKKALHSSNVKRTFAVKLDKAGEVMEIIDNGKAIFTQDEIKEMAEKIWTGAYEEGMVQKHQYLVREKPYGCIVVFLDCTRELENMERLVSICLTAGVICIGILFITVICLSYWAVKPVEEGFKRQKQFVADASHELKTPLSVISANASVLESKYGENQWTGYIQAEVGRMSRLLNDMLRLARMEQPEMVLSMEPFDFSKMSLEVLLSYESLAYEQGKQFEYNVDPELACTGNRDALTRVLHIFVDNAFKYSEPGGLVKVNIKRNKKKIWIQVYNTGEGISKGAHKQIFERFYRVESSHSREKEGYGLGLSIAHTILKSHHGRVNVRSDGEKFTCFEIQF